MSTFSKRRGGGRDSGGRQHGRDIEEYYTWGSTNITCLNIAHTKTFIGLSGQKTFSFYIYKETDTGERWEICQDHQRDRGEKK